MRCSLALVTHTPPVCRVFPLAFVAETLPLPCAPTEFVAKALSVAVRYVFPLASVAKTLSRHSALCLAAIRYRLILFFHDLRIEPCVHPCPARTSMLCPHTHALPEPPTLPNAFPAPAMIAPKTKPRVALLQATAGSPQAASRSPLVGSTSYPRRTSILRK